MTSSRGKNFWITVITLLVTVGIIANWIIQTVQAKSLLKQQLVSITIPNSCTRTSLHYEHGDVDRGADWKATFSCNSLYGSIIHAIQTEMGQKGYSADANNYPEQGSLEYVKNKYYINFLFPELKDSYGASQKYKDSTPITSFEIYALHLPN